MLLAAALITLALATCDDVVGGPSNDLVLACHSPSDKFTVPVVGQKAAKDEMDAYVSAYERTPMKSSTSLVWAARPTMLPHAWQSMQKETPGSRASRNPAISR
jgi:hypothetical protein